jgi:nitrite reductase/ring-hydroxylating ferredoxin subunit/uncharacterized membrane protein
MARMNAERVLRKVPGLQEQAHRIARGIHKEVLKGGRPARTTADVLHGRWLGHPLHAALTDATVGAWVLGSVLDCLALLSGRPSAEKCADRLIDIGNITAVPTALSGLTDFTTIPEEAMASGATHGLLNVCGFLCNLASSAARKAGLRPLGVLLSAGATVGLLASAWLGGELMCQHRVGVNRTRKAEGLEDWIPVLDESQLPDDTHVGIDVDDTPVLLYRHGGVIYAMGAVCGHAAGALELGTFEDRHVTCPLHQSVYDVRDGSVVHSPSLYPEPTYDVRVREGKIELKAKGE